MKIRILLITSLIFLSASAFSQIANRSMPDGNSNRNQLDIHSQTGVDYPPDMLRNYDQLLARWKQNKNNRNYLIANSSNCLSNAAPVYCSDSVYMKRLYALPTKIELPFNPVVKHFIESYLNPRSKLISVLLGESQYYFPLIDKVLDRYQLPLELKYLPVIESALNPIARSRVGATGLWQFMIGTGKIYDLEINSLVDERRDPLKSTDAAARYLQDLYSIYDDWILVLAAYNCGPGNVNKAIRRSGGKTDYWSIYPYLPRETRGYVPAFIAASYIMNYYQQHNIESFQCEESVATDTVHISKNLHFRQVSELLGIPLDELREYNPQYKADIIPGNYKMYVLKLPIEKIPLFIEKGDSIYTYKATQYLTRRMTAGGTFESIDGYPSDIVVHRVKRGETLGSIAHRYRTTVRQLIRLNHLRSSRLAVGRRLEVYHKVSFKKRKAKPPVSKYVTQQNNESAGRSPYNTELPVSRYYRVVKGDTWFRIAKRNHLTVAHLKQMNKNILYLHVGSRLLVYQGKVDASLLPQVELQNMVVYQVTLDDVRNLIDKSMTILLQQSDDKWSQFLSRNKDGGFSDNVDFDDNSRIFYYKVKPNESLDEISAYYHVSKNDIMNWNNLSSDYVQDGQRLLIRLR